MGRLNPQIKKAHKQVEYTPEHIRELLKCSTDPIHFMMNYVRIQHPVKGTIPFELYDYQKKLITSFVENRLNVVLSARQTGKCCQANTSVMMVDISCLPLYKKVILWLFNRKVYHETFKSV